MSWTEIEIDESGRVTVRRGGTLTGEAEPEPEQKPEGKNRLYIWHEFAPHYNNGLAVAIAPNEVEAMRLVVQRLRFTPDNWGPLTTCTLDASAEAWAVTGLAAGVRSIYDDEDESELGGMTCSGGTMMGESEPETEPEPKPKTEPKIVTWRRCVRIKPTEIDDGALYTKWYPSGYIPEDWYPIEAQSQPIETIKQLPEGQRP